MWNEILKFEIKYRLKRPETYLYFVFLTTVSIFGVDFIFQGVELGLVSKNAPVVISKTMGAITGIFMIAASLIMGIPMIRDDQYQITPLVYTLPIRKLELLVGRYLGSFIILVFVFSGVMFGMMIGEFLPWRLESQTLPFRFSCYLSAFLSIMLPALFFGSALFFVSGTLSRKLLVVYTQGIVLFAVFLMTKAIPNEYLQAVLDPFSLTTISYISKEWPIEDMNNRLIPFADVLLIKVLFWTCLGIFILWIGYRRFNFSRHQDSGKPAKSKQALQPVKNKSDIELPIVFLQFDWISQFKQFAYMSLFFTKTLLKERSFWAIIICAVVIILVNSINLGTVYEVDSYPTTYLILEELQEMSLYFFIIILLFYTGELYWKENDVGLKLMIDATSLSTFINLSSKAVGLIVVYIILMLILILSGILFQITQGYYDFNLPVYFSGFFIEILPFLAIYTCAAFFIHAIAEHKFMAIIITLVFFLLTISLQLTGIKHVLLIFGGNSLQPYSEMNGYGHYLSPYLWLKAYWLVFGSLLLILASRFASKGVRLNLLDRLKSGSLQRAVKLNSFTSIVFLLFIGLGATIYYQTHVLNEVWTQQEENQYRANYEKTLKRLEYSPQPNISAATLHLELYPKERSYTLEGEYTLRNDKSHAIHAIHIQKTIDSDISLDSLHFSIPVKADRQFQGFEFIIYQLITALEPGDSLKMTFKQSFKPKGFELDANAATGVIGNGTFIRNSEFPTLGYNRKYELRDDKERKEYGLAQRPSKAHIDNQEELKLARSGSNSDGIVVNITIGTSIDQIAVSSGQLSKTWTEHNRKYTTYNTIVPIINFYSILSGRYEILSDTWQSTDEQNPQTVDLEIYHHPQHDYNLDRMMHGMKASLDYYSTHFSPFQYQQLRIVEFPRYADFAQSFPSAIPFSESIGFMLDIDDATDIDMTFFITAHEVAHQWWGMQVEAAHVKGQHFILETLAQYSALMVFKNNFTKEKVDQFITLQHELYEKGKKKAEQVEAPLYLVEHEEYIYYNKGAILMYELQNKIGEDNVNLALRAFIRDWNTRDGIQRQLQDRYATSQDLITYILDQTEDSKRKEVRSMFTEL